VDPTLDHVIRRAAGAIFAAVAVASLLASCGPTESSSGPQCSPAQPRSEGTTKHEIESLGAGRSYLVHVPPDYDGRTRLPVIFLFHGIGSDAGAALKVTRMQELADQEDVIVVAPQGAGIIPSWNYRAAHDEPASDVAFAHQVLDRVKDTTCVDPDRVYAAGFSNGSALILALACEDSRDFAAFGAVSAPYYEPRCDAAPPRSIIYFHGAADIIVPYSGADTLIGEMPPVTEALSDWATHDQCRQPARKSVVSKHVSVSRWSGCAGGSDVAAYLVAGGGHRWPGGIDVTERLRTNAGAQDLQGPMTQEIHATKLMWEFFAEHPR
jgi:polyhydroxybutyrate depolymerase